MPDTKTIMEMIKENDIRFVDLRFTDPRGKWQHLTQAIVTVDEESLNEGFMFDGSSIAGWKAINESDMCLMPDLSTATVETDTDVLRKAATDAQFYRGGWPKSQREALGARRRRSN